MLIKGYAGVMSVEVDLLTDGMCFAHFISTPGVFDFTPPRTLDGGIAQFGFLKAVKSYVVQDESFGLTDFGCRVESSEKEIRVYPQDGLKKRLRFVPQNLDLEVIRGEINQVSLSADRKRLELSLTDSTGVVEQAAFEVRGLEPGEYLVRYGGAEQRIQVSDVLTLSPLIVDAKSIRIEKL